jgi:hypothetical protein
MEVGGVSREVFTDQSSRFGWSISAVSTRPGNGWADTVDQAKDALECAWLDWVARAGPQERSRCRANSAEAAVTPGTRAEPERLNGGGSIIAPPR